MLERQVKTHKWTDFFFSPTLIIPPLVIAALQKRGTFSGPRGKALEMIASLGQYLITSCESCTMGSWVYVN